MLNLKKKPFPSTENENNMWIQCAIELLPELFPEQSTFSPQEVLSLLTTPHVFVLAYAALGYYNAPTRSPQYWIDSFRRHDRSYSLTSLGAACYLAAAAAALVWLQHGVPSGDPEPSWCANDDRLAPSQAVEGLSSKVRPRKA